jgi:hypothetical protein
VTTIRHRSPRIVIGRDDPTLTPAAGLALVAEVDRILAVAATIDDWVGRIKDRDRGLSAGELVVSMAECMLSGGDFMCDLDNTSRADVAGAALRAVPDAPASTTFIALARRFDQARLGDLESAVGALAATWFAALPEDRRHELAATRPTLDLDPTDIEVYGAKKQGVAWNYAGQRCGRAHPAVWAETGIVLAGELGSGVDDPRPQAPGLIERAVAALPDGLGRPRVRADSGFFDRKVAEAALANGADFAIAAKRNTAVWRSAAKLGEDAWAPAVGMAGAEVAVCDYAPGGWPEATRTIVRRVRVEVDEVRRDPRSRRRRNHRPHPAGPGARRRRRPRLCLQLHRHQPRRRSGRDRGLVPGPGPGGGASARLQVRPGSSPPAVGLLVGQRRVDVVGVLGPQPVGVLPVPGRRRHRRAGPRQAGPAGVVRRSRPGAAPRPAHRVAAVAGPSPWPVSHRLADATSSSRRRAVSGRR